MNITTFESDFTSSKFAKSPYGDKTFDFQNEEVKIEEALEIIRTKFILNRNYIINKPIRLRRTKKDLQKFLSPKMEFVIVDFDMVKSQYAQNMIVQFFKDKDYYVGIIPSRSWNGVDSFNLKGILKTKGLNTRASIYGVLEEINETLFEYCKIDLTSMNEGAYQAPSFSEGTILLQKGSYIPNFKLKEVEKKNVSLKLGDNHNEVIDVCLSEYSVRGFSATSINEERGLISFSHPSERTANGFYLFLNNPFYMHHFNSERSFNIFEAVKGHAVVRQYLEGVNSLKREEEFSSVGVSQFTHNINSRFIKVGEKETKFISKWLDSDGLLKLKSAMGTGKSTVIEEVIKQSNDRRLKVLLITNRISVAKDFQNKYDLKLYSEGKYEIGDDLIVQFDSLWRYSLRHFDVIILDEFVSVMLHSRNTMGEYGNLNRVKLMYAMRTKLCMIADAFLFGIEDKLIPTKPKFMMVNDYREDIKVLKYPDIPTIISEFKRITLNEKSSKVSVSCTTKTMAKALETMCEEEGLVTLVLSADTLEEEKEDIYKVFDKDDHDYWDVLIYTPTLTVGVSIMNKTDHHFHIDESVSVDVISSIQMIRRSRKATNIHYFVNERKRFLETDVESLNKEVKNNIEKYYKKNNSLLVEVDEYGDFKMSKIAMFINDVEVLYNKLENNHKHSFELLLKHQISSTPELVQAISGGVDINRVKRANKLKELEKMKSTLDDLCEVDYDSITMEEFEQRSFLISDKEKLQKFMSEISKSLKDGTSPEMLREITALEISKGYKFINKLKKLKFFQTKNEADVSNLLGFLVGENTIDQGQIQYFKYIHQLKKSGIKLKSRLTNIEIKHVDQKLGWGDFRKFLTGLGFVKRGGVHYLTQETVTYSKLIK